MALDDLKETIETLRERIQAHRPYLEGNETRTRQALIDPMLRTLGWDVENPNFVQLEYGIERKRADYALMRSARPIAVIEAKRLGKPLDDDDTMQALNYANREGIDYTVVTNGDHWWMLDVFKRGRLEDRVLMEFRLTRDKPHDCALQVLNISRPNLVSGKPQEATEPVLIEKLAHNEPSTNQSEPSTPEPSSSAPSSRLEAVEPSNGGQDQEGWMPLTSLKRAESPQHPTHIKFPDSSTKPLKHWVDLWVSVAEYLIEAGKISAEHCPVRKEDDPEVYLLHTKPFHSTGKEFQRKKEIGKLWLNLYNVRNVQKYHCWLLERFGVSPSTIRVSTNQS